MKTRIGQKVKIIECMDNNPYHRGKVGKILRECTDGAKLDVKLKVNYCCALKVRLLKPKEKKKHSYLWHSCPICNAGYCIEDRPSKPKKKVEKFNPEKAFLDWVHNFNVRGRKLGLDMTVTEKREKELRKRKVAKLAPPYVCPEDETCRAVGHDHSPNSPRIPKEVHNFKDYKEIDVPTGKYLVNKNSKLEMVDVSRGLFDSSIKEITEPCLILYCTHCGEVIIKRLSV